MSDDYIHEDDMRGLFEGIIAVFVILLIISSVAYLAVIGKEFSSINGVHVSPYSEKMCFSCTDTRDGETFSFSGENVSRATIGWFGSDTCFDVIDDNGIKRTLCSRHDVFIKCKRSPAPIDHAAVSR